MPRFVVQRTFPDGLHVPTTHAGAAAMLDVVDEIAPYGVTWVHSYVTADNNVTYCVYDGPDPESIRSAAAATGLPVDRVSEVRVLDPYFYHWSDAS